jgi:hypothetical protein
MEMFHQAVGWNLSDCLVAPSSLIIRKMYLSVHIFACSFNTIPTMKCVNGCLKIILDTKWVTDVKLEFPGLYAYLTCILSFFSVGIFENQRLQPIQERSCGVKLNNLQVK